MISDTDYDLLNKRLESIERSIEMLKAMFPEKPKPVEISDVQIIWDEITKPKYIAGRIPCMVETLTEEQRKMSLGLACNCPKCSPYALSSGSLQDSGLPQIWRNNDEAD